MTMLAVRGAAAGYGTELVIDDCDLTVKEGQVVLLMGRNGAGKTTLLSAVAGRIPLKAGQIDFNGQNIVGAPAYARARDGLILVPQGREVVGTMSVAENLALAELHGNSTVDESGVLDAFPVLGERYRQTAGTLSGGELQMLTLSRALVMGPRLLMLDEPSMGLAPRIVEDLFARLEDLVSALSLTVLIVEQQLTGLWESGLIDYVYVLDGKQMALEGPPEALDLSDLQQVYLGTMADDR